MKWISKLKRAMRLEPAREADVPAEREASMVTEPASSNAQRLQTLTPREREVFALLTQGKTMREAAAALGVKHTTISFHTTALYKKLEVHNRTQLILRYGLPESAQVTASTKGGGLE